MALKKSELYSTLWSSCDELRGGMDASQYKDYVLVLLFIKYISDKYANQPYAPIKIPQGATFQDMIALKGKSDIGDQINKKIIAPLVRENKLGNMPDFNDSHKLGSGKEMVNKLTNLIAIFENSDFSQNRADGDDLLGDAYEYLMMHFAAESGKSKGQFYTPSEVSQILAKVIEIHTGQTSRSTTVYDPTCGSGSLLLKVANEARSKVTLYGQEKDATTSGLAKMNMILHDNPTAEIKQGNTITYPKFKDGDRLKTFDYVVANPPFSDKRWSTGIDPHQDPYQRFQNFGVPPFKQGDYAYLLHIIRSLKSTGKGACILPHGVLFRGNVEAEIRKNLVKKGYIKGIIGLPANLFYGTGIPACVIIVDKSNAQTRKGIFMINASKGFMKDGNKNRLRAMDIHKIVDTFIQQTEVSQYSRMVQVTEIEKNDYNLNLPRYIDSQESEDIQDIQAHLKGGIPQRDIEALEDYWKVCPNLKKCLFKTNRHVLDLSIEKDLIYETIIKHPEFKAFVKQSDQIYEKWSQKTIKKLKILKKGFQPKKVIDQLSKDILADFATHSLINKYDIYQHLMNYWNEVMQDDCYLIFAEGWKAETRRVIETDKKGKEKDKGWVCDLIPKSLMMDRFFISKKANLEKRQEDLDAVIAQKTALEEDQNGEDGIFIDFEKINKTTVKSYMKDIQNDREQTDDLDLLTTWMKYFNEEASLKKEIKELESDLDEAIYTKYSHLTDNEVKAIVIEEKWLKSVQQRLRSALDQVGQRLSQRIKQLYERYEDAMPKQSKHVSYLEKKVTGHLKKMGFVWD